VPLIVPELARTEAVPRGGPDPGGPTEVHTAPRGTPAPAEMPARAIAPAHPDTSAHRDFLAVVILAAGEGTRMKSARPKVMHSFAGRSMLGHVLAATAPLDADVTVVVVGHGRDLVTEHLRELAPKAVAAVQHEQRGTGHAVRVALQAVEPGGFAGSGTVLVLPGDAPLLRSETLAALLDEHRAGAAAATMLTSQLDDPTGYGRVLRGPDGGVLAVVEHRDASAEQRLVSEVSALVYAFDAALLHDALGRIGSDNSQGEEYLPDVIALLRADGREVRAVLAPAQETAGVNDRVQLAAAHRAFTDRVLEAHMRAGVTVLDPASTWIDADVRIDRDVTLLPGVHLLAGTTVARGATIGPDCSISATSVGAGATIMRAVTDGVSIGADALIGPFAYLRGGADVGESVKIGTFVEVKNSTIGARSKVPHLSYVGDATIGQRSNIGAATIFANYDGVRKNRSVIGDDVRIGSDTTLVAPVHVGDRAYTGAGTVVREDVPADALAVSMGPQRSIEGWAARRRAAAAPGPTSAPTPAPAPAPPATDPTEGSS
jgi:bifunctional UDP-N-acetylglucosamine pyrophosphorylase/glucosamine-1-phosphate N-acetyltransferase